MEEGESRRRRGGRCWKRTREGSRRRTRRKSTNGRRVREKETPVGSAKRGGEGVGSEVEARKSVPVGRESRGNEGIATSRRVGEGEEGKTSGEERRGRACRPSWQECLSASDGRS